METLARVIDFLERYFPSSAALPNDRVGFHVATENDVERVLCALELTQGVVEEALQQLVQLLYLHHPPILTPLSSLSRKNPITVMLITLFERNVAVFVHHTNLDVLPNGFAEQWVNILNLKGRKKPLLPGENRKYKLVTFVPPSQFESVSQAAFAAGAGVIGNYRGCSFFVQGTGTFLPQEGAQPFLGKVGQREEVQELRLEIEVSQERLHQVVHSMLATHPYEEPVIDIYPLSILPSAVNTGLGRWIELDEPLPHPALLKRLKEVFPSTAVFLPAGREEPLYRRLALCPGSGRSLIDRVIQEKSDAFLTGDLTHHDLQKLHFAGITYFEIPHAEGERKAMYQVYNFLRHRAREEDVHVEWLFEERKGGSHANY